MQVFTPYPEPIRTALCLDKWRLSRQLAECQQILDAIDGRSQGWKNHPVTKMYAPYREWLDRYRHCLQFVVYDAMDNAKWWSKHADLVRPPFLTEEFCDQHKRRLYAKDPTFYADFASYGASDENWYVVDGQIVKYIKGKKL